MGMSNFQKCQFGIEMMSNPLNFQSYNCDKVTVSLKDCIGNVPDFHDPITFHEEREVILLRACMDKNVCDEDLEIWATHKRILGKNAARFMHMDCCMYKGHQGTRRKTATKHISFAKSIALLRFYDVKLPYKVWVIKNWKSQIIGD